MAPARRYLPSYPLTNALTDSPGLTADPIGRLIKKTALNPAVTLILLLLGRYTKRGSDFSILHETAASRVRKLFLLGLARVLSNYLSRGVLNNWRADEYNWDAEIVLITGGAGGIGGSVARLLAERGTKVVVLDVIPLSYSGGENISYYACDITSPEKLAAVAAQVRAEVGVPTVLINNAGVCRGKTILGSSEADVRFTFDVNTLSHYFVVKEFLPSLVERNHGMVVTVASYAAHVVVPSMVDYASSKAAALSFHEGLAAELKTVYDAPKVRTVAIVQGYTKTALFEGYTNDSPFLVPTLEVDTVAEEIVKSVWKGESGMVVVPGFGATLMWLRALPSWYANGLRNKGVAIMKKWNGRQVMDVEKKYQGKKEEKEKEKEGSSVSE